MVALHCRRHHVLLLLHNRHLPWPCGDRSQWRSKGQPRRRHRRRRQCDLDAEGLAKPAGLWEHRVRLRFLNHSARDPGHDKVAAAVRGQGDEEGDGSERGGDHRGLPTVRVRGVRGVRQHGPGQHADGLRLLRALLAVGRGERLRRGAPDGHLPGHDPAGLRLRRAPGGRRVARQRAGPGEARQSAGPNHHGLLREPDAAGVAHSVRVRHHGGGHAAALLRLRGGVHRGGLLLAAHGLLPRGDVHRAARGGAGKHAVAAPAGAQRRVPRRVRRRRGWVDRRRRGRAQDTQPVLLVMLTDRTTHQRISQMLSELGT